MKIIGLVILSLLIGLAGCQAVREEVRERVSPQYKMKVVKVDQRTAYAAALKALGKMNYTFERGGPAQGVIHAVGPMDTSVSGPGTARQYWFDARFSPSTEVDGATNVEILFSFLIEEDFSKHPGQGTLTPMRDTPLYEVFFNYLDQALAAR